MGVVGDHPVTLVTLGDIKNPLVLLGMSSFCSNDCFRKNEELEVI